MAGRHSRGISAWKATLVCAALAVMGCVGGGETELPLTVVPGISMVEAYQPAATAEGEHPSARDYPIHGIDVARYQGTIDWREAASDPGVRFAWIKATEGGDMLDPEFRRNWAAAAQAGIPRGAYHFWYMCRDGASQLAWFIENVPRDPGALPPMLNMEWNPDSPTCRERPPRDEILREIRVFLRGAERHYGKRPVVYTSVDFHEERLDGHKHEYPFWVRSVAAFPSMRYPAREWVFWQYTARGQVAGIEGEVDRNVFNGDEQAWQAWLARNRVRSGPATGVAAAQ